MIERSWAVTSPAGAEPWALSEVRAHLRVTHDEENDYITALIAAARGKLERDTGRALITQTVTLHQDMFTPTLYLPRPPAQAITGDVVHYTNTAGDAAEFADYQFDAHSVPARIKPKQNYSWPQTARTMSAVWVIYTCGYGASGASVPRDLLHAGLVLIGHWYENREATTFGRRSHRVPLSYGALIGDYCVRLPRY